MTNIQKDIQEKFCRILRDEIQIKEFENWVYNSPELKKYISNDDYLNLISFDYKKRDAEYEIQKEIKNIFRKYIDEKAEIETYAELETCRIKSLLKEALNRNMTAIRSFYYEYYNGYDFLECLFYPYGVKLVLPDCPVRGYRLEDWTTEEQEELVNSFFPEIIGKINKVLNWIDSGLIILTGTTGEYDHWECIDNRVEADKTKWA